MYVHFAFMYVYIPLVCRDQERMSESLELELHSVVSHLALLGIETGSLEEQPVLLSQCEVSL